MRAWLLGLIGLGLADAAEARPIRILSLDQCADQYVLALAPDAELALSPRADDPDAWLRREAAGRRRVRSTLETAVGFRPDIVVRYWGGEPRLLAALERRGARVVAIAEADTFDDVRENISSVSAGLDRTAAGQAIALRMDRRLAEASAARRGGSAMYLTSGGFTAGPGTLVHAILSAAGFVNLTPTPGFGAVSVERIALAPPFRFVLGFFDQRRGDWRGPGRHPVVMRAAEGRTAGRIPAAALTCPAWFAADAAAELARGP